MSTVLMVMFVLFIAYLYFPATWLSKLRFQPATKTSCSVSNRYIPEDAVLRRHFISQLRLEIEAALHPRPTDSILQRHYDALVAIKLEQRLAEIGRLRAC